MRFSDAHAFSETESKRFFLWEAFFRLKNKNTV